MQGGGQQHPLSTPTLFVAWHLSSHWMHSWPCCQNMFYVTAVAPNVAVFWSPVNQPHAHCLGLFGPIWSSFAIYSHHFLWTPWHFFGSLVLVLLLHQLPGLCHPSICHNPSIQHLCLSIECTPLVSCIQSFFASQLYFQLFSTLFSVSPSLFFAPSQAFSIGPSVMASHSQIFCHREFKLSLFPGNQYLFVK